MSTCAHIIMHVEVVESSNNEQNLPNLSTKNEIKSKIL